VAAYAVESQPIAEDMLRLDQLLYEFNVERTGLADGRRLAIFLRGSSGEVTGGLLGWTWGGTCYVDLLYLPAALRGRGIGSRLMAAAESEARSRGCGQMVVRTHDFQAPGFYRRLGFAQESEVAYPTGYMNFTFLKRL
jgi:ribosomal protein S18 acetylase RimI-like enzyme